MCAAGVRLVVMDMDGTVTQHKSDIEPENRRALEALSSRHSLLVIGAGSCERIHTQLKRFPLDIVGYYGMAVSTFDAAAGKLSLVESVTVPVKDESDILRRAAALREKHGYTVYAGDSVEFHASGMLTFPLLGTSAPLAEKLAFDPSREKRRPLYNGVCAAFPEYTVFIGGTSSFDIVPRPYDKLFALDRYLLRNGFARDEAVYFGDDYGIGGNDRQVYESGIRFIKVDDYRDFARLSREFLPS